MHASDDLILTTREAASYLGVSVTTAQLWVESGKLQSWKTPGGHRRCKRSEIERLLRGDPAGTAMAAGAAEFVASAAPAYPVSDTEQQRLIALARCGLVDSAPDPAFDRITWLASEMTRCPIALVSLLTSSRQWFKSRIGLAVQETPRSAAFCSHAILSSDGLVVEDALQDERFSLNPLVTGEPRIRFYAGIPITDKDANRLGTLCVIDVVPRQLTAKEMRALEELAHVASAEVARG